CAPAPPSNSANSGLLGGTDAALRWRKDQTDDSGWRAGKLSGCTPGEKLTLYWLDRTVIGSVTAGGTGTGLVKFRTPLVEGGTYSILAKDASGMSDTVLLRVLPRINATLFSGYPGTVVRIYLYGYGAGDTVALNWYANDQTIQ